MIRKDFSTKENIMKKIVCFLFCLTMVTIFFASSALAIPLGTNITISDKISATRAVGTLIMKTMK